MIVFPSFSAQPAGKTPLVSAAIFSLLFLSNISALAQENVPLTEIVVTAELLEKNALSLANSVSVIDAKQIEKRGAKHLEELLNLAPNVNFATGASRGRFIQIRGIGERSEFQEPIINSVGVLVDGIDLTGISTAATTLDIKQIEVLRGPQGTLHGANALAGLVNLVSNKPDGQRYGNFSVSAEEYGGFSIAGTVAGAISENSAYRLALQHVESDGFTENVHLNRDDTNNIKETSARARWVSQINDRLEIDASLFLADIDNGYDAFSLDNTRQTYSDQPGVDQQKTVGLSIKSHYEINENLSFDALISNASSELEYSFDEDWSHTGICENTVCDSDLFGFDWFYSSFDQYSRENDNTSLDVRLVSKGESSLSWVTGVYFRDQDIELERIYTFADADFSSRYDTQNIAVYGQVDYHIDSQWSFSIGARLESRDTDYADNTNGLASTDENFFGGRVALEYQADSGVFYYGLISRGYKPGGFNLDASVPMSQRQFDEETMTNYELGVKNQLLDGALSYQLSLFYQSRDDIQSKQSIVASIATGQVGGQCPCSFTDFTDNASSGTNKGLELELSWQVSNRLGLFASIGLLDAEFDNFPTFEHVDADRDNGIPFNLQGREQAHAPSYQWVLGGEYAVTENWIVSGSIEAKDDFLFSDRHEERSDAYELLNLQIAYQTENWQFAIYGKNLSDELVKTRGFGSFGNDPRNFYQTEPYNQFAAPRIVGVKASMEF